jgi:putative heme-binding domain-containing protein
VDIKLGPDGALYVADFYNRIIGHYEVPLNHPGRDRERGRIWRITYKGEGVKPQAAFPRDMTTATAEELAKGTTHPNLTVRTLATNQLVARQVQISKVMGGLPEGDAKGPIPLPPHAEHLFWAQERLGQLGGSLGLWVGGATPQGWETLIVHAFRIYAQRRELVKGIGMLGSAPTNYHTEGLRSSDPFVRRASADAAGQQPRPEYITPLLAALAKVPAADTHLRHTIRMALRNQLLPDGAYANLPNPLADADLKAVADVSLGVPAATAAAFLAEHLDQLGARPEFVQHCARFGAADLQKDLVARVRKAAGADLGRQVALFRAVQQGTQARGAGLDQPAKAWADDLVPQLLAARDGGQIQAGIDLAQALRLAAAQPALTALVQGLPVAPARLQSAIAAGMAGSPQGAGQLLDAVAAGKASARLLLEAPVRVRLDQAKVPGLADRVAQLTKGLPPVDQKLVDLINRRRGGFLSARPDAQLGAQVFTKHCANCHQIGGQGAKVGPQLDGIGARGLDRLLEDTLDPNRNVDQAFRATTLGLSNGQVMTGLVLREEGEVVVLADAQGKEQRIPKGQIEQRATSQLSPMPANVADQVPEADFYHLLAYLLAQRAAPTKP